LSDKFSNILLILLLRLQSYEFAANCRNEFFRVDI
jgi:hypothetical protein